MAQKDDVIYEVVYFNRVRDVREQQMFAEYDTALAYARKLARKYSLHRCKKTMMTFGCDLWEAPIAFESVMLRPWALQ